MTNPISGWRYQRTLRERFVFALCKAIVTVVLACVIIQVGRGPSS